MLTTYKGFWTSFSNSPVLVDGTGTTGDYYQVVNIYGSSAPLVRSIDLGSGSKDYLAGGIIYYDGTEWQPYGSGSGGGGGNGGGTVTSINIIEGNSIEALGGPITSSGDITVGLKTTSDFTVNYSNQLMLQLSYTTIVAVTITTAWTIYKNDGTTPYTVPTSSSKNLTTETGCKVEISSTYIYPAEGVGQGIPTAVTGSWGTTLPGAGVTSSAFTNSGTQITTNSSYSVTITKPKSGFITVSNQLQRATGNDSSTDSTAVTFYYPIYYGVSTLTSLASSDITALTKSLQATSAKTNTGVTTTTSQYYYFIYPASYPAITRVIANGALDVFGSFTNLGNVMTTLDSGVSINMAVLRTNALGAFTSASATLAFS